MSLVKHFRRTVRNFGSKQPECGVHAKFFHINDKWGVKYFHYEEQRDENYDLQKQAIDFNLAPKLGNTVTSDIRGVTHYGFITEKVTVFMLGLLAHYNLPRRHYDCVNKEQSELYNRVYSLDKDVFIPPELNKYAELCNKIDALPKSFRDSYYNDLHDFNWGVTKSGEAVLIDFSLASPDGSDWSRSYY